jgi:hypothetical protein
VAEKVDTRERRSSEAQSRVSRRQGTVEDEWVRSSRRSGVALMHRAMSWASGYGSESTPFLNDSVQLRTGFHPRACSPLADRHDGPNRGPCTRTRARYRAAVSLGSSADDSIVGLRPTVFLLSPAQCGSVRAGMLTQPTARFPLARQLQSAEGASLGEVFAFLSALYFRGKLAYAQHFERPPAGVSGVWVITPGMGLLSAVARVGVEHMLAFADVDIHHANERYAQPLVRDLSRLALMSSLDTQFVLLGSVASAKYLRPLQAVVREQLFFPAEFIGRGDMSRGGLLLRCAREHRELEYIPVAGATLHGKRPPRLPKSPVRAR